MMQTIDIMIKANWVIWCLDNGEQGFMMIGSRKVNQLDLEADYSGDLYEMRDFSSSHMGPSSVSYKLTGSLAGFTMVVGKTEFEAFITLMHTFQEEERKEQRDKEALAERIAAQKLETKNEKKRHHKSEKARSEGKFDAITCTSKCYYCKFDTYDDLYDDDYSDGDLY